MKPSTSTDEPPVTCLGGCGRKLTSRLSKRRRYGPDCWRKLHGRTPRIASPTADVGDGQTELPLDYLQVTLWSL